MSKFADHLYEDLMAEHGSALSTTPVPAAASGARRRIARPAWATAGAVAAAGATALGVTVFGGAASAYAVTDNHDGTVTVSVSKAAGIDGANTQLQRMGARVVVLQADPGCPSLQSFAAHNPGDGKVTIGMTVGSQGPGSITVQAQGLPDNETALVAFSFDGGKATAAMVPIHGPIPTCVSLPTTPPPGAVTGSGSGLQTHVGGSGDAPALDQQKG
jgi:hypothetical protein